MKYKYQIIKVREPKDDKETHDYDLRKMALMDGMAYADTIFQADLTPDEIIEIMQHLWDIVERRKKITPQ